MKKFLHISISLLLSALILLSGSGLVIGKMVCLKSKHEVLYASEAKDCCKDEAGKTAFESKCCDVKNISFHPINFVPANHLSLKSTATTIASFLPVNTFSLSLCSITEQDFSHYKAPPLHRSISASLPLLGIFRI